VTHWRLEEKSGPAASNAALATAVAHSPMSREHDLAWCSERMCAERGHRSFGDSVQSTVRTGRNRTAHLPCNTTRPYSLNTNNLCMQALLWVYPADPGLESLFVFLWVVSCRSWIRIPVVFLWITSCRSRNRMFSSYESYPADPGFESL
jgi:hypothetical protein